MMEDTECLMLMLDVVQRDGHDNMSLCMCCNSRRKSADFVALMLARCFGWFCSVVSETHAIFYVLHCGAFRKLPKHFSHLKCWHDSRMRWVPVQAKDLECYLERMWHISLPGFSSRCVTSAPKIAAESADMKNRASVRTYLAQLPVQQPTDGEKKDETGAAGGS